MYLKEYFFRDNRSELVPLLFLIINSMLILFAKICYPVEFIKKIKNKVFTKQLKTTIIYLQSSTVISRHVYFSILSITFISNQTIAKTLCVTKEGVLLIIHKLYTSPFPNE